MYRSIFVNHGRQMLIISILMALFESLDQVIDPRYLKQTILSFFGSPRLDKMVTLGCFANRVKVVSSRDQYPILNCYNVCLEIN